MIWLHWIAPVKLHWFYVAAAYTEPITPNSLFNHFFLPFFIYFFHNKSQRVESVWIAVQHPHHCGDEMAPVITYVMLVVFITKWTDKIGR